MGHNRLVALLDAKWSLIRSLSPIPEGDAGRFARHETGPHAIVFLYNPFVTFARTGTAESRRATAQVADDFGAEPSDHLVTSPESGDQGSHHGNVLKLRCSGSTRSEVLHDLWLSPLRLRGASIGSGLAATGCI